MDKCRPSIGSAASESVKLAIMHAPDDIDILDFTDEAESPLDHLDPVPPEPGPDPEKMLSLLQSEIPNERTIASRAFAEIQDARAVPALIQLLSEICPLMRVSAAYALGRNP
ncbi:MAG: hypothetical protein AAGG02_17995, partial [Cyanobacteria bacterium P01_H01_bin.15]